MDETTREEYIRNDILKYNKLKNKISERIEEVWNFDSY